MDVDTVQVFEKQYSERGLMAQRLYPNEQLIQFIALNYFSKSPEERGALKLLEMGCGTGANLWMLAKEGFDVHGIDASQTALDLAKTHLAEKWGVEARLSQALFQDLPYQDCYFDAVCDVVSLQHLTLEKTDGVFKEVHRCLKPGGLFFSHRLSDASVMYQCSCGNYCDAVTIDNVTNPQMPLCNNGNTSFWSPGIARLVYERNGFKLQSMERFGRTYEGGLKYVEYLSIVAVKI